MIKLISKEKKELDNSIFKAKKHPNNFISWKEAKKELNISSLEK